MTVDLAALAQSAVTVLSVIVMIVVLASSMTVDLAALAQSAATALLVIAMLVPLVDHLVASLPIPVVRDLAPAHRVSAAQSDLHVAPRPSVHSCRRVSARMPRCLLHQCHQPLMSFSLLV